MTDTELPLLGHEIQEWIQNQTESGKFVKITIPKASVPVYKCHYCQRFLARKGAKLVHDRKCIRKPRLPSSIPSSLLAKLSKSGITINKVNTVQPKPVTNHRPGFPDTDKAITCYLCLKIYPNLAQLKCHIACHRKERLAPQASISRYLPIPAAERKCSMCDIVFENLAQLSRHNFTAHISPALVREGMLQSDQVVPYESKSQPIRPLIVLRQPQTCNICDSKFNSMKKLYEHKRIVHKPVKQPAPPKPVKPVKQKKPKSAKPIEEKYVCSFCGRTFIQLVSLQHHIFNKHEDHPYIKCELCSYQHTDVRNVKSHMSNVHGPKIMRYTCDKCGNIFTSKPVLKSHLDTHLAEKRYKCKVCMKRFAQKPSLSVHIKTVHLRSDLPCKDCPKIFKNYAYLYRHRCIVHRNETHCCDECGETFKCLVDMNLHRKLVHKWKKKKQNVKV